ncbi:MAG: hypothetical protein RJB08_91 [Actinomycetota bacterium]
MTIEKGQEWGRVVSERTAGVPCVGDLAAEVGIDETNDEPINPPQSWRELPLDVLEVTLTTRGGAETCVDTHLGVIAGRKYLGNFLLASSLSFVSGRRIFTRAHPNDGKLDWLMIPSSMPTRQRLAFFRRTRLGDHLPHPAVSSGSAVTFSHEFARPVRVRVNERSISGVTKINVRVRPDGTHTYIPAL